MGYDKKRFVISTTGAPNDLDEFVCTICMDVLDDPVFSHQCCRQSYCRQCIGQWLKQVPSCPNDRSPLTMDDLIGQSRAFTNLLDQLRIRCDYNANGCPETPRLADLAVHTVQCRYNPTGDSECSQCGVRQTPPSTMTTTTIDGAGGQHNCVANLQQTVADLKSELRQLREANCAMLKANTTSSSSSSGQLSDNNTSNSNKRSSTTTPAPGVLRINMTDMTGKMQSKITKLAVQLATTGTRGDLSKRELAVKIKQTLDKQYGQDWTCMIRVPDQAAISFYCEREYFINFDLGPNDNYYIYQT
ncbi:E3 ubiquitin-protein ligase NRDP1-like [Oppia nitens]|uniref:E3 ubiquitin-protein ligase NRDP1-like n=1 Tax=Oppia nitens TaxID=1686743 RepID=UPI0023DC93B6|nr:E3 ubiquitin-protein ligase NRDP1-like [Oppia nitens]